ncbi:MAG: TonB-dependent receptor [Haliscomenobacter sp.]|nr:TonB-dependent receptor [Haliscomenobacter sp.]
MFRTLGVGAMLLWGALPVLGQYWIRGEVTSQQGQPLEGANVWLVETRQGTVTNQKGQFELEASSSATLTLEISYLGYSTYRSAINAKAAPAALQIALQEFSYQVDELVVRGTRSERRTPMTFLNVRREDIRRLDHGQDLPVLLQWTPSAVVTSDAGTGVGYTGIRIRGTDATRINVTINGIPANDAESQAVYWVNMPDFSASAVDIQIQRGVGSSTNGAGAFGATINVNTSRVNHELYAGISAAAGSFNTWKRNVEFGTGLLSDKFTVIPGRRTTTGKRITRPCSTINSAKNGISTWPCIIPKEQGITSNTKQTRTFRNMAFYPYWRTANLFRPIWCAGCGWIMIFMEACIPSTTRAKGLT